MMCHIYENFLFFYFFIFLVLSKFINLLLFDMQVPPGEYRLSALPIKSESSSSLIFSPPYVDVKVNSPVLNVEFFQVRISIQSKLLLVLDTCGGWILLYLCGLHRSFQKFAENVELRKSDQFLKLHSATHLQAQVNIQGSVLCKENCQSISVSLVRLVGKGMEEKKTTIVDDKSGNFMFAKVFPGKYFLEVCYFSDLCSHSKLLQLLIGHN